MSNRRYNAGMTPTDRLAAAINEKRNDGAFTLISLSRETGIHQKQLSRFLNRRQPSITFDDAALLAEAADLSLDEFLELSHA